MWHGTHPSQLPRRLPDPPRSDGPSRDLQRVPDPNRQYSMPRTVTSIEARLTESQRRILPKRIPDPPRSDGPSRDLRRVPGPNRQFSRSRTGASIEARLREAQKADCAEKAPRLPDPDPMAPAEPCRGSPTRIGNIRRVPGPNRQFSRSRTGASIEARLREAQRQTVPKGLPDPPRSDRPSRVLWRVPGPNRQFPCLGQVSEART